jgi:D-3-phosphoglycerate dehydrogenase
VSRPRILVAEPQDFSPSALAILASAADVDSTCCSASEFAAAFQLYDVVWLRLGHRVTRQLVEQSGLRCRLIATPVTGLDHIDLEACAQHGIAVVSLRGETDFLRDIRATAELTLALALALLRKLPGAIESVRRGEWNRDVFRGRELFGKVAGIVGVGRLGTIVAGYLRALGMEVLGYDPRPDFPAHAATRVGTLDALLTRADLLTIHVSVTPASEGLIGGAELALLKRGAVVINTARGSVLDHHALLTALQSRHVAGAALDVVAGEPDIGPDHPLVRYARDHDNLVLTPHIGGNTIESFEKTEVFLARRVVAALARAWT